MLKKMTKYPLVKIALVILVVFITVIIVAQFMAKNAVSDFLTRKLPRHVQLEYKNIDVNVLTGTVELNDITLDFFDRDSMLLNTVVNMEAISLKGLGYWQFFVHKRIAVQGLHVRRPQVKHYLHRILPKTKSEPKGVVQLLKTIEIGDLTVKDGQLNLYQEGTDSLALEVSKVNFTVKRAKTGPEQIQERIPVTYGDYELGAKSLFVNLGPYEELKASSVLWNHTTAKVSELRLKSKYQKLQLSKHLHTERDYIDLNIPEMDLDSINFGFEKDTFFIATGIGTIRKPNLEMFRDKFVDDDESDKEMYSHSLRQLPIQLTIPKIEITEGNIIYSERVADVSDPGKISFNNFNATLSNISNTYTAGEKTEIQAETKFMDHADISLNWSFDTNKKNDAFTASGVVSNFRSESINPFLKSNLRAKASGTINRMYFTVSGDAISSSGDMKMKYENFEFSVLKKNRLGINKVLTAVGKLFINDGSNTDAEGFRYGSIDVERDPTKSFFNYLWLNVREGTINTLTGKGEKRE